MTLVSIDPLEPVTIRDAKGREYTADPDLTAKEALSFIKASRDGVDPVAMVDQWAAVISRSLSGQRPDLTPEAVLELFPLRLMSAIMASFLALTGLTSHSKSAAETTALPTTPTLTTESPSA